MEDLVALRLVDPTLAANRRVCHRLFLGVGCLGVDRRAEEVEYTVDAAVVEEEVDEKCAVD